MCGLRMMSNNGGALLELQRDIRVLLLLLFLLLLLLLSFAFVSISVAVDLFDALERMLLHRRRGGCSGCACLIRQAGERQIGAGRLDAGQLRRSRGSGCSSSRVICNGRASCII